MNIDPEGPAMDPPHGVIPDFASSQRFGDYVWLMAATIISTVAVLARVASSTVAKRFVIEDYCMIAALGVYAGIVYVSWHLMIVMGMWCHQWNVPNKNMPSILYYLHLGSVFYGPAAMFVKIAILFNWLRIFVPKGQRNFLFWLLHVLIWSNVLYYVITTITEIFRCWPRKKIWDIFYEGGVCRVDVEAQNIATSVLNFVSDTTILCIPQWMIWKLNMSRKRRWGLSLLFTIGIGAWAFGIVRTVYFVHLMSTEDATYEFSGVALWSLWELTTGFLVMGIPAFPRAFKAIPGSTVVITFFRSLSSKTNISKSMPFRHMYKPRTRRRRSVFEISELDTHILETDEPTEENRTTSHDSREAEPQLGSEPKRNVHVHQLETI